MGLKEAGAYGTSGALAGSVLGPWGAAIGGVGGAVLGLLDNRESDAQKAARRAELAKQLQFQRAGDIYSVYRQQLPAARMAALQNRLGAYAGVQQALNTLYPGSTRVDPAALMSPIPLPSYSEAPAQKPASMAPAGQQGAAGMPGSAKDGMGGAFSNEMTAKLLAKPRRA